MTPLGGTSRLELRMHERFVLQELMDWQRLDAVTGHGRVLSRVQRWRSGHHQRGFPGRGRRHGA